MQDETLWQVELTIAPEQLGSFRALTNEMVESTRLEDGVLAYERFLSEDGAKIFVYERYANSDAALLHLQGFQEKFGESFGRLVKDNDSLCSVCPTMIKGMLSGFDVTLSRQMAGFSALDKGLRK